MKTFPDTPGLAPRFSEAGLYLASRMVDGLPPPHAASAPMHDEEPPHHRTLRFARIRRMKFLLRFLPRRARFHTYPLVGRFAAFARTRSYLWSFRYSTLRPSLYAGSILSLMPFLGVQVPFAFALALALRTNFMVLAGLQLITNPVTAGPIYYGTYKLGVAVIQASGYGRSPEPAEITLPLGPSAPAPRAPATSVVPSDSADADPSLLPGLDDPVRPKWTSRLGTSFNALIVGGLLSGLVLGAALDLLWRLLVLPAARHRAARKPVTALVTPHDDAPSKPPFPPSAP